jgi:phosphoglycolate phosphatase-like HAD superfamily hydrolase
MLPSEHQTPREILFGKKKLLIDFDDTLVATFRVRSGTLSRTARLFGVELPESAIRSSWGRPFPELIRSLLPMIPYETFFSLYREEMRKDVPVSLPGARELLVQCKRVGQQVFVHSSSHTNLIEQDIDVLGWSAFIDGTFGIDRTGYAKPDLRSLTVPLAHLARTTSPVTDILYIGDSPSDSVTASGAGLPFIGVLTGLITDKAAFPPQTIFIQSLNELVAHDTLKCQTSAS